MRALLLEAEGATGEALATLAGVWDGCVRSGLAIEYPVLGPDLVRLSLAANERGRASEVAAGNDVPSLSGAALRCRGLAEDDPRLLCASVEAYATGPLVPLSTAGLAGGTSDPSPDRVGGDGRLWKEKPP